MAYDDDDRPVLTSIAEQDVRARKEHTCGQCRQPIRVGETYRRRVYKVDGDLYVDKLHGRCIWGDR